jgi:hypothetical protein
MSKVVKKKLSKSCQKNSQKIVKKCQNFALLLRLSGEEGEEEDWWILDQVATSSHLVKMASETRTIL